MPAGDEARVLDSVVCFADEGGLFHPCSDVCVAVVCFARLGAWASSMLARISSSVLKRMLGWRRGELKCRSVKKAARRRGVELGEILATIRGSILAYSVARRHLSVASEAGILKVRLLEEALLSIRGCLLGVHPLTLILDANLVPASRRLLSRVRRSVGADFVDMRDSRRYPGLQLADLYAGACGDSSVEPDVFCVRRLRES